MFQTKKMSSVGTGQMSAVETRQMSSAETRQMCTGKKFYMCLVSAEGIWLVSRADIWRCLFCILPADTVGAGYHGNFLDLSLDLGPRDLSQRIGNGCAIHLDGFSGPGDHSGPISGHFRDLEPDRLSATSAL